MKKLLLLILHSAFCIQYSFCFSQNINIGGQSRITDSLMAVLKTAKNDTNKIHTLNRLCEEYINIGEFDSALHYGNVALDFGKKINFKTGIASAYSNLGIIYDYQGNYNKALENHFAALKISEGIGNKQGVSNSYNNIGVIYYQQGNKEKALENYISALKIRKELGNKRGIASSYNNIGGIYSDQGKYDKALENHFAALKIREEIGNKRGIAASYNNIGANYYYQGDYNKALKYHFASLKIREELGDKKDLALIHNNIGDSYLKQHKPVEAKIQSLMSLNIAKETGYKSEIIEAYLRLSLCDSATNDWKGAYDYHKLYKQFNDSIFNEESTKKTAEMNAKYESGKKEAQILLLEKEKEKEKAVSVAENKRQKTILISVVCGLFLVIVFSVFMFNRWRITQKQKKIIELQKQEVEHQKHIVEEKNHEISGSISYAKRIQRSFLTSPSVIKRHLPDHFILFKPRDVVSGDFYWMHQIGDYSYFCVADCTGHGIPGAFMSLIGMGVLNEIVYSKNIVDTKDILNELRRIVILAVNPEDAVEEGKDGMDLVYLRFHLPTKELQYSAANNSFYICRKGELLEFKPDKMPVGSFGEYEKPFTQHTVQLEEGDIIYAITDGYADQFGGPKGKKFKYKQLEEQLIAHRDQAMEDQKKNLEHSFENWRGDLEQVDDVTVVGIRI